MPRFTLYYDGDKPDVAAADAERVRQHPGIEVIAVQPGLLLISTSHKTLEQAKQQLTGWVASEEQCISHPKPLRPAVKPASPRKK